MEERIAELRLQNKAAEERVRSMQLQRDRREAEAQKCEAQLSKLVSQYKDLQRLIGMQKRLKDAPPDVFQSKRKDSGQYTRPKEREATNLSPGLSTFGPARGSREAMLSDDVTSSHIVYEYSNVTSYANSNDPNYRFKVKSTKPDKGSSSDEESYANDEEETSNVYLRKFLRRKEIGEGKTKILTPVNKGKSPEAYHDSREGQRDPKTSIVSIIKHKVEHKMHNPNFAKKL
jgi:hypothetical protein